MPNRIDWSNEDEALTRIRQKHGIRDVEFDMVNPYCFNVMVPLVYGDATLNAFATDLFHELGLLDENCNVCVGEGGDFCDLIRDDEMECYCVIFNHHLVAEDDDLYEYSVAALRGCEEEDEKDDEAWMRQLAEDIKSGAIRSKSGEGYFVLKGEYYDAIEAGHKTTEYRDLTPRNLAKSIGITTVKLQRGYGHPGQPPRQMRFEVSSVGLLDASDRECDLYAIPPGFIATTIAIHLGKKI